MNTTSSPSSVKDKNTQPSTLLNIQADDFFNQPKTTRLSMFSSYPLLTELNDTEDAYAQFKQYALRLNA